MYVWFVVMLVTIRKRTLSAILKLASGSSENIKGCVLLLKIHHTHTPKDRSLPYTILGDRISSKFATEFDTF